jgi:zinc protease
MSIVSLRTLSREPILRKALNIFTEVVTQPSFEQTYLTRAKRQIAQIAPLHPQVSSNVEYLTWHERC